MANKLELPADKDLAGKMLKAHYDTQSKEIEAGFMGKLFGFASEKPGNIASFAIVASLISLLLVLFFLPDTSTFKREALTLFGGIITLALGYVFGRNSSSAD